MKQITLLTLVFLAFSTTPQLYSVELSAASPIDPGGPYLHSCTCDRKIIKDSAGYEQKQYACICTIKDKSIPSTMTFPKNYCGHDKHFDLSCVHCEENKEGILECKIQTAH